MCQLSARASPNRDRRLLWRRRYHQVADGRRGRRLVAGLIVTLSVVLLIAVACGGGGGNGANGTDMPVQTPQMSLEEYYQELSAALGRLEQAAGSAAQAPQGVSSPEGLLQFFADALASLQEATLVFIQEIEALQPPEEASAAHQAFLEAARTDYESLRRLTEDVRDADNIEEAMAVVEARAELIAKSREPCRQLQQIAREHNIDVELPCER